MTSIDMREVVKQAYGAIAAQANEGKCCGSGCCQSGETYSVEDHPVPEAELGLSCGNPVAFTEIKPGDVVLDLGSGAGKDVFLAARRAGPEGRAIGVDMTPEMLQLARRNAEQFADTYGLHNVEFREGHIEELPVEENTVDLTISNCVINLSPDKPQVFREVHRVLRPGGRMVVSDIVLNRPLPPEAAESNELYSACIAGALLRGDYLAAIEDAGFDEVQVLDDHAYDAVGACSDPVTAPIAEQLAGCASSITVRATKR